MQTIKWIAFAVTDNLASTLVHFFPSAGAVTAPYPAQCKLSIFNNEIERRSVVLDGARVSQPDGVRLEDVFTFLRQARTDNLLGLEIELSSNSNRVNLDASKCVVDLAFKGRSSRYIPHCSSLSMPSQRASAIGCVTKDSFSSTSLLVVNGSESLIKPAVAAVSDDGSLIDIVIEGVQPGDISETALDGPVYRGAQAIECSWGLLRARSLVVRSAPQESVALYLVYRDVKTRRPISVCEL